MSTPHTVTIEEIESLTPDVGRFVTTKPENFEFKPGQATEVSIPKDHWKDEKRPFTFSSLPEDPKLEFTIKIYPERDGVTDRLAELEVGEELEIGDPWGAITYQGPGVFIAGGAGVTPFLAILRDLHHRGELDGNRLIFSNDTESDIILAGELKRLLGDRALFLVTDEKSATYPTRRIDKELLAEQIDDFEQYFYVCGPPDMVEDVTTALRELGVEEERIVTEE
ncbi:FAD-binding oxidoreductase [Haloferula sp. A504]|uniref:FAD-binding oxidoreductase n=1 Tax=Haloferula sp. A504 TaxID=3373601 RepID=UPI0031CA8273|nr:FAD-binding oxidoreductase [Verrucomicrobiaceae bacterium E54]